MIVQFQIAVLFLSILSTCNGYRILAIFPFNGRSHFQVLEQVAKALARKGHQIDVLSNYKLTEPFLNYTELEFPTAAFEASIDVKHHHYNLFDWFYEHEARMCNLLGDPKISALIKNPPRNPPYDAVLVHMWIAYQCFNAIGHVWDIPVISVATSVLWPQMLNFIGNPLNLATTPGLMDFYKRSLTFWERVCNVVKTHKFLWRMDDYRLKQETFLKNYFGPDFPSHRILEKNVALMLTNTHHSFHGNKALIPAIVEIGGINIKNNTNNELEPILKKLLDESNSGFIYVSFGTLTIVETLPQSVLDKLYTVFRNLSPMNVIMRAKNPDNMPKNLSDNVFIFKWLPQQKLLEHPNIEAFVTHGGGLSAQEAIHYAVPVICIPLFAEQKMNCDIFSSKNMGVRINVDIAEQADYDDAFQKVITDSHYKENMKKFSLLYWDRPQSPQEAVNYWVEYVIRHGKNVLRSNAVDLEWWQSELIDAYCFLFTCIIATGVLSFIILGHTLKLIIRFFRPMKTMKSNEKLH